MQSPLKRITVYDLETGGLSSRENSITEFAGVAIDVESLEIVEEFSVLFKPRLDLRDVEEDSVAEAKALYKTLGVKDTETGIKTLHYKNNPITLKNLEPLVHDIDRFKANVLTTLDGIVDTSDIDILRGSQNADMLKLFFDKSYNPRALEVTKISEQLMREEGLNFNEAFEEIEKFFLRHKVGNNKPILSGHNIKRFDNPFLDKLFKDNKKDLDKYISSFMIDTLEWARLRFTEISSFSLGVCANEVGLTLKEAHRALPDTVANAKFLIKLLKSMRGEGSQETKYVRRKFNFNF